MIFLDLEDLLHVARRTLGEVEIRDIGLLDSAAARPRSTAFGEDAYPSIHEKAAALLHSIARNHPLIDGNKRLSLAATLAFYGLNGVRLTLSNDEAYELIMVVAAGELDDVGAIAGRLEAGSAPRIAPRHRVPDRSPATACRPRRPGCGGDAGIPASSP